MKTIYIHKAKNDYVGEFVKACRNYGLRSQVISLEQAGCVAQIIRSGPGLILFRPDLHLTNFNACIRTMGTLHELGYPILPSWRAVLSYDDKIIQHQQMQDSGLPHCETQIVTEYDQVEVTASSMGYPLVVKLRSGAASSSVQLIRTKDEMMRYAKRMFSHGISPVPALTRDLQANIRKTRGGLLAVLRKAPAITLRRISMMASTFSERNYVLMQRFYGGNEGDIRVTIIGNRAFVFGRQNRQNDFRASGSGKLIYSDYDAFGAEIELAFQLSAYLQAAFLAVDIIKDAQGRPVLVEYCPGFVMQAIERCPGYVRRNGAFVPGSYKPVSLIIQDITKSNNDGNHAG